MSPLLANLFMHYAFDTWMDREYPGCPFERYADDVVVHCNTEAKARDLWAALAGRLGSLGLELHPDKTKVVYCKDTTRRGSFEHTSFDFLGHADLRVMPTSAGISLSATVSRLMRSA
ncbi:MAG: reverse transcriptase domain-containing protein [Mycobacteriales bacterium]